MRNIIYVLCIALAGLLAGCEVFRSQVPVAVTHEAEPQYKMQAAGHWRVLASDVADRIAKAIDDREDLHKRPLFLTPPDVLPFSRGFHTLLTSELVSRGMQVSVVREPNGVDVDYDVMAVLHNDRFQRPPIGSFTALAGGISAARMLDSMSEWIPAAIGAGVLADIVSGAITEISDREILISVSMAHNNRYVMYTSSIYYINDPDYRQYVSTDPVEIPAEEFTPRRVRVTGK